MVAPLRQRSPWSICYDAMTVIKIQKKRSPGRPRKHADLQAAWRHAAKRYRARKRRSVHHSSDSQEWYTPPDILGRLLERYGRTEFDLDPCSPNANGPVPATMRYTKADDGLAQPWHGLVFCNPPYGRDIGKWVDKVILESHHARIILLIHARTDTAWWHRLMAAGGTPEFLQGRIKFLSPKGRGDAAPFPSVLVEIGMPSAPAVALAG